MCSKEAYFKSSCKEAYLTVAVIYKATEFNIKGPNSFSERMEALYCLRKTRPCPRKGTVIDRDNITCLI